MNSHLIRNGLVIANLLISAANLFAADTWWVSQKTGDDAYAGKGNATFERPRVVTGLSVIAR